MYILYMHAQRRANNDNSFQGQIDVAALKLIWKQNIQFVQILNWLLVLQTVHVYKIQILYTCTVCVFSRAHHT